MLDWLSNRYSKSFEEEELSSIKNFALIWNIFEGNLCNSKFSIQTIENKINNSTFSISDFQDQIAYFKMRYADNNTINNRFYSLNFRKNDRIDFVKKVLLNSNKNTKDILLAITIIIYRLRNNLFHGLKNMYSIEGQRDNFMNSNLFLMKLIDNIERSHHRV